MDGHFMKFFFQRKRLNYFDPMDHNIEAIQPLNGKFISSSFDITRLCLLSFFTFF